MKHFSLSNLCNVIRLRTLRTCNAETEKCNYSDPLLGSLVIALVAGAVVDAKLWFTNVVRIYFPLH